MTCICISKYEGVLEDDLVDTRLCSSYVVIKKQPFFTSLVAFGLPTLFLDCSVKLTLNYYDAKNHSASVDQVSFVKIFPIEYKTRIGETGGAMEVEITIHSLSSQHQGALFCVVIEVTDNCNKSVNVITTVPLKVVSKTDSLSATIPTSGGHRKTITELLGEGLNKVEISEFHSTKMLAALCKANGVAGKSIGVPLEQGRDIGALVHRLCQEYRLIVKSQRAHRLQCELAGLLDDELRLLSNVNQAFCESFQKVFDYNYQILLHHN